MLIHFNLLGEVCTRITIGRRNKSGDDRVGEWVIVLALSAIG